jgi:ENTS family enterobactin (siderophore) exporter
VTAILGYCVALVLLAVSPWFMLSLVAAGLLGLLDSLQATPRNAVIQSVTPDEVRGRVSSFQSILTNGVPSLGQTWSGVVAAALGPTAALIVGASACATLVVTIAARRPDLRARDLGSGAETLTGRSRPT